jgi:TrmH family RNA methyltransferase
VFLDDELAGADELGELGELAMRCGAVVTRVPPRVVASLSDTPTPQGVVAVAEMPDARLHEIPSGPSLVVVLAGVRDPGNAGTLIRSAAAAGADAIVFCTGTVDPWHPKSVRSAAGAAFALPVVRGMGLAHAVGALRAHGCTVLAAEASGPPADECDLTRPVAFVLGNEASGMDVADRALVDGSVSVPMPGRIDSLNVAIAGSVLLFEASRQRRAAADGG